MYSQDYQEHDELKVPSSPPRRLSRSSIDLRDLEHEREKTIAQQQNLSESASSIYHCFDGHIRYSGSEPINTNLKALENQFNMKSNKEADSDGLNGESKASVNQIPFTNNFERSSTKENDVSLTTSASVIKDNQVNISGCSLNNSQTNKKHSKKKMLASSDSDFFSLLRYNSEKLRRINCFSISTNNNGNKPKNMIYALSDSDFLIGVNDKNKNLNLNNERKSQAIVNKSDIFNFLINQKSIDYKNLLDNNNFAQNNHHQKIKSSDVDYKKHFDNPDLFNMEKLKAVFGEGSANAKIIESISLNDDISSVERTQKKETVSLPPIVNANNDFHNVMLNNSHSIDTVLLNMKNNADKLTTVKPSYDFSKNNFAQKSLNDESMNVNNVMSESLRKLNDSTSVHNVQETSSDDKNCTKYCDVMNPVTPMDDKNITRRKRTPSNVTYNVNVINFQADDEPDTISGGYGKRSNSSTSELPFLFARIIFIRSLNRLLFESYA